ncbi:LysR family transcriptional regulator [Algicola sagamiensis]|uniref:LysR family transcriptional regulator n=1 Tax=Algicola sagamiensis TaxID=163869 RepID=UPI00036EFDAB|nr:LysR family transcriptional regulator [Algicola sagamiensis]
MDKLSNIQAFVYVIETGGFATAAKKLDVTNSVITKRVSKLEESLNIQLLHRTTRRVQPTEHGLRFYQHSLKILQSVRDAESEMHDLHKDLQGLLRISCPTSFASSWLNDDICEFQQEHPQLDIELVTLERSVDPLEENFDLSLQVIPIENDHLMSTTIAPTHAALFASRAYLEKYGTPQHPNELMNHRICHNSYLIGEPALSFFDKDGTPINAAIKAPLLTNNIWLMKSSVLAGNAMAIIPYFFIEKEILEGKLIPVLPDHPYRCLVMKAYYPKTNYLPNKTRYFLDKLKKKYQPETPWQKSLAGLVNM